MKKRVVNSITSDMKIVIHILLLGFFAACAKGTVPVVGMDKGGQQGQEFVSPEALKEVLVHSLSEASAPALQESSTQQLETSSIVIGLSLESEFGGPIGFGIKNVYEFHYEEIK